MSHGSTQPISAFSHLECGGCQKKYPKEQLLNLCPACSLPLLARYDIEKARSMVQKDQLVHRESTMWRYREMMPVEQQENIISLGEGWTPLVAAKRLGTLLGFSSLYLKDESLNPTGSFKARGMSAAISAAKEKGVVKIALPTAGNAGGAAAAYAAKAGQQAYIFMPADTPMAFKIECEQYGAVVEEVDGLISDCGKIVGQRKEKEGWFDVSTLKEPYRVEGKKTMGYEIAEQSNWTLPDVIIYPTGGGTGIVGMWKAFDEMEQLGWIDSKRPRMISVQAEGCAPIVHAFKEGLDTAPHCQNPETLASGLRVPGAVGDFLILQSVRESGGCALAVSDDALIEGVEQLGTTEGIFAAPEAGATIAALIALREDGLVQEDEKVVLFITGSGLKYVDTFEAVRKSRSQPS
jgi:threonine synthase